jgi:hypothetical protein
VGLLKLQLSQNTTFFAFLKNEMFKNQLEILISKGATIRHAKKLF